MSVRFFKIFSGVFLAHLVIISIVWVGFSAPFPRPPALFTYQGALPADEAGTDGMWQKDKMFNRLVVDWRESSFTDWARIRELSKPSYDRLEF